MKPSSQSLQSSPVYPGSQAQVPVAVQDPWPLQVDSQPPVALQKVSQRPAGYQPASQDAQSAPAKFGLQTQARLCSPRSKSHLFEN